MLILLCVARHAPSQLLSSVPSNDMSLGKADGSIYMTMVCPMGTYFLLRKDFHGISLFDLA